MIYEGSWTKITMIILHTPQMNFICWAFTIPALSSNHHKHAL